MNFLIITTILDIENSKETKCQAVTLVVSFNFFLSLQFQFSILGTSSQTIGQNPTGPTNIHVQLISVPVCLCNLKNKVSKQYKKTFSRKRRHQTRKMSSCLIISISCVETSYSESYSHRLQLSRKFRLCPSSRSLPGCSMYLSCKKENIAFYTSHYC